MIMTDTFTWAVLDDVSTRHKPEINKTKLGGMFEQRTRRGMVNNLPSYQIKVPGDRARLAEIDAFLVRHAGVDSFIWTPPRSTVPGRFVCETWSVTEKGQRGQVSATFRQVLA